MKNISRPSSIRLRVLAIPLLTSLCLAAQAQEPIPAKRCPRPPAPTLEAGVPYPPGKSTLTVRLTVGEAGDLRQLSIEGPDIFRPPIEKVFADYRCAAGDAALELSQTFVFNIASSDRGPVGNVNSLCKHMSVIDPNDLPDHLPDGRYLVRARSSFEPDGRLNVAELKGQPALYPAVTRALQRYRCASSALIEQEFEIRIES